MEFRDALKLFRSEKGIAQSDIATALHINIATVGRWEQGRNVPNRSVAMALLSYARHMAATEECIRNLECSLVEATKQKLLNGKSSLFTVEHSTISQLIEDAAFPIYVCDISTGEMLYVNRAMEQRLGKNRYELVGAMCYKCIMDRDEPCDFCAKGELADDSFTDCDMRWPIDGKTYLMQGKLLQWNGRSAQVRYILNAAGPETANPAAAAPETASPAGACPETANPAAAGPETANPAAAGPETASPSAAAPETANPAAADPEAAKSNGAAQALTAEAAASLAGCAGPEAANSNGVDQALTASAAVSPAGCAGPEAASPAGLDGAGPEAANSNGVDQALTAAAGPEVASSAVSLAGCAGPKAANPAGVVSEGAVNASAGSPAGTAPEAASPASWDGVSTAAANSNGAAQALTTEAASSPSAAAPEAANPAAAGPEVASAAVSFSGCADPEMANPAAAGPEAAKSNGAAQALTAEAADRPAAAAPETANPAAAAPETANTSAAGPEVASSAVSLAGCAGPKAANPAGVVSEGAVNASAGSPAGTAPEAASPASWDGVSTAAANSNGAAQALTTEAASSPSAAAPEAANPVAAGPEAAKSNGAAPALTAEAAGSPAGCAGPETANPAAAAPEAASPAGTGPEAANSNGVDQALTSGAAPEAANPAGGTQVNNAAAKSGAAYVSKYQHAAANIEDHARLDWLKVIFANMNGGVSVVIYRNDGGIRFAYANEHYYKLFGYTKEQYTSEVNAPQDTTHPEDRDYVAACFNKVKKTGEAASFRYRIVRRDKSLAYIRCNSSITTMDGLEGYMLVSLLTDISESMAAEQQLASQHQQIEKLLNDTPGGIAIIEIDANDIAGSMHYTYYNDKFIESSGYNRDEYDSLIKSKELNFVFKEDVPAVLDSVRKLCAADIGHTEDLMIRCHKKDGSYCWLLFTGQLTEKQGDNCVINVAMRDVTLRQEAIANQHITEEMLRIAAETDKRYMIVYNIKKHSCRVESRKLFSAEFGQVIENVPQSLIDMGVMAPGTEDSILSLFTRIDEGERNIRVSLQLRSGPDKYEWFECNADTVLDAAGLPDQAVLVFHNVTEQRLKEAIFSKWQHSIDSRAPETYTLYRCNLSRGPSMDQRDGELLKIVYPTEATGFNDRTKLYVEEYVYPDDRDAYLRLLDLDTLMAKYYRGDQSAVLDYREIAENGQVSWRRLTVETVGYPNSTDVQAFLMYEDIDEAKKAELEALELAKSDPLTGALNRGAFMEKVNDAIVTSPNSPCALVMLDMDGFKKLNDTFGHAAGDQALQDVVAVLRSFTRSGDLVCRLGGDEFVVWLRDVPYDAIIGKTTQQICEHIRKAYSQEVLLSASAGIAVYPRDGRSYDELYQNADKALYSVKQNTKGSYAFFSQPGEAQPEAEDLTVSEAQPASTSIRSAKRRMLIVDDSETSRVMLKNIFKGDYLIETAKNGAEAMIRLRHFGTSISIVLLDLLMPDVDGFTVLKRMQTDVDLRTIPTIVVTGDEDHETLLKVFDMGAAEYVTKPVDVDVIRMRVKSVISKAENERLRAQNSYLMLQRDEEVKYHTVLESTGTSVIEHDWRNHVFHYDKEISKHIAGNYDSRGLWQVFLSDMVADSTDVKLMQDALISLAGSRDREKHTMLVKLKTPKGDRHWFRVNYYKSVDSYGLADKIIITFNDVHEEVLASDRLLFQATRDELTGLYNRAGFLEKAAELIAKRPPGYYMMSCINVEKFQVINDRYGTNVGDEVLKHMASAIDALSKRHSSICGRHTGDKFAVLFPARLIDTEEIKKIYMEASTPACLPQPLRLRVGRYLVNDLTLPINAIFDRATMAETQAKGRYGTYVVQYEESMRDSILKEQQIVGDMTAALELGQFEPWFQPQYNHSTGALIGAEALVRWRKGEEIIPPDRFIPIFEKNGFIYEVDQSVWRQVCIMLSRLLEQGKNPLPVSVNISRCDLFQEDFIDVITGLLAEYHLPAELLHLEITESAFSEDTVGITNTVNELMAAGFTVEIDDFGSGYSSLNTLKDVSASILKLDMRFFEHTGDAKRGGNIVESVVRMAKWLGMAVIAEGVEDKAQADYLKSIGCFYIQGYLYAKPMPLESYVRLLDESKKEGHLNRLQTLKHLDNNDFWDAHSMDSLIFNSYVGAACIFEQSKGRLEMLRATDHFVQILGGDELDIKDVLAMDWSGHMDATNLRMFADAVLESLETKEAVTREFEFHNLPKCPESVILQIHLRVIATVGERYLIYCLNENITAMRLAELREKRVSEEISVVMDNVSCGIGAIDMNAKGGPHFIFTNDQFYTAIGYTKEQIKDEIKSFDQLVHPDDKEKVKGILGRILASQEPLTADFRLIRRDGSTAYINSSVSFVEMTGYGNVAILVQTDISDVIESRQSAQKLANQLAVILNNTADAITAIAVEDGKPHLVFANDKYFEQLGVTKEAYANEYDGNVEYILEEDKERVAALLKRSFNVGTEACIEFRIKRKDGLVRWLRSSITVVDYPDVDGPVQLAVTEDITDMKDAVQKQQNLTDELMSMMSDIPGGFIRLRVEPGQGYRATFCNEGICKFLGMDQETLMSKYGEDPIKDVHPEDVAIVREAIFEMERNGQALSSRFRVCTADGDYVWVKAFGRFSLDQSGNRFLNLYYSDETAAEKMAQYREMLMDNLPWGTGAYEFKDGQMSLIYQNRSYWDLVGLVDDKFPDTAPMSAIHPEDIPLIMQELAAAIAQHRDVDCNIRLRHATMGYRPVNLVARVVPGEDGGFLIVASFIPTDRLSESNKH